MKIWLAVTLLEILATAIAPPPSPSADESYANVEVYVASIRSNSVNTSNQSTTTQTSKYEKVRNRDRHLQMLREAGSNFLVAYPNDVRRYQVMAWLMEYPPLFIKETRSIEDGAISLKIVSDIEARVCWDTKLARLLAQLDAAPALSSNMSRERAKAGYEWTYRQAGRRHQNRESFDLLELRKRLLAWFPYNESPELQIQLVSDYFYLVDDVQDRAKARVEYEFFATSPNEKIRQLVRSKLSRLASIENPVDLKFTALDGRQIDLAELRGKLILLDFWATWCGPCVKELPAIQAAYKKFHGRGLEVIGISMDSRGSRERLVSFVTKRNMPWPQHYEGRKHNEGGNSVAARFGVTSIPDMFLLDRNGMIVATKIHGNELERRIQELLNR